MSTIIAQMSTIIAQMSTIIAPISTIIAHNTHNCKYCNKIFTRNYSVIRHEQKCKVKLDKNKLDNNTKDIIEKFINKINYVDTKYTDYEGKEHENYKLYKINEIKVLLFNNQDKITSDISLLLTTNEVTTNLII